eukprot:385644_1
MHLNISEDYHQLQSEPPQRHEKRGRSITQIESICTILDKTLLILHLNIPTIINKEIAKFARGEVEDCSNPQCKQPICILDEEAISTCDIMYKRCILWNLSFQIFCIDCMEFVIPAMEMPTHCRLSRCKRLQFLPDCPKCDICDQYLPKQCECKRNKLYLECCNCGSKECSQCRAKDFECVSCQNEMCSNCKANTSYTTSCVVGTNRVRSVCIKCYDDTVIECGECNASYPLLYTTNHILYAKDGSGNMQRCGRCSAFVCSVCIGTHWRDQEFKQQPAISYENALQILLNEGGCLDIYDFSYCGWRPAKYFCHWNHTQKIMISYTDHGEQSKWRTLSFPSSCILISRSSIIKTHKCAEN